jgi:hypothetical protein
MDTRSYVAQPISSAASIDCLASPRPTFTVDYNSEKVNDNPDALYYLRKFAQPILAMPGITKSDCDSPTTRILELRSARLLISETHALSVDNVYILLKTTRD